MPCPRVANCDHCLDNSSTQFRHDFKFHCRREILRSVGASMSNRAREFLNHWKLEHVTELPHERRLREVVRLVTECRNDAASAGIPADELRAAADDGLFRHLLKASAAAHQTKTLAKASRGQKQLARPLKFLISAAALAPLTLALAGYWRRVLHFYPMFGSARATRQAKSGR